MNYPRVFKCVACGMYRDIGSKEQHLFNDQSVCEKCWEGASSTERFLMRYLATISNQLQIILEAIKDRPI